jgi:hypothetical protein
VPCERSDEGLSAALVLHSKHNSFTTSKRHQHCLRKFLRVSYPMICYIIIYFLVLVWTNNRWDDYSSAFFSRKSAALMWGWKRQITAGFSLVTWHCTKRRHRRSTKYKSRTPSTAASACASITIVTLGQLIMNNLGLNLLGYELSFSSAALQSQN